MAYYRIACIALFCAFAQPDAAAQTAPPTATDPGSEAPPLPPPGVGSDWVVDVGAGTFYAPAFLGPDDYQLFGAPIVSVHYKDRAFTSAQGIGADLVRSEALRAGATLKFQMARRETNGDALRIAGERSDEFRGDCVTVRAVGDSRAMTPMADCCRPASAVRCSSRCRSN